MAPSITRLTLYALISAIERDLRAFIMEFFAPTLPAQEILDDAFQRAFTRWTDDADAADIEPTTKALLPYADMGDLLQVIGRHRKLLPDSVGWGVKQMLPVIERLLPVRNRVMHSRPLNFDDLAIATKAAESLAGDRSWEWRELKSAVQDIEKDPGSVLRLDIPPGDDDSTFHNLPTPDFDETGFIGRQAVVEQITGALLGPFPVVTIVGEGGVGKTALALKVAYDVLDLEQHPFDAVVFTTAKTTQLTVTEIRRIEQAISTSVGLLSDVAAHLGGEPSDNPFDDILEQLKDFRVLLVLDNLETVLDDRIRTFLGSLPMGSKVLITSRIGVGAFEYPIKLGPLESEEAVQLLRAVARARGIDSLTRTGNKQLAIFCNRMRNNPLHIKWFVAAVQAGRRPEEIISNEKMFLEFCMSNVYDFLNSPSRTVLRALLSLGGKYTLAELAYVTEFDDLTLQAAVQQLATTNMLEMSSEQTGSSFETRYGMSALARAYLSKLYPLHRDEQQAFVRRKQQLISAGEEIAAGYKDNPTSRHNVHVRNRSDWVVAKYLRDALTQAHRRDFTSATDLLTRARNLAPSYYEVYRITADIDTLQNNLSEAVINYEAAIELEPNSASLRYAFGRFLLTEQQDVESAMHQLARAREINPKSVDVHLEFTRCLIYSRQFDQAKTELASTFTRSDLTERQRRKLTDLQLSYHQRRADNLAAQEEPEAALGELKALRAAFENVVAPDEKMRFKLDKSILTARSCLRQVEETPKSAEALELLQWLSRMCSTRDTDVELHVGQSLSGVIKVLPLQEKFGFIQPDAGPALYFSKAYLKDQSTWPRLFVGERVRFVVGENQGGMCAMDVTAAPREVLSRKPGRNSGEVVRVRQDMGFGFLRADDGPEYFFHRSAIVPLGDWFVMNPRDRVTFDVATDTEGRPKAVAVRRH
jgi:LuxR family transcriptional regulator, glucitol operon activator